MKHQVAHRGHREDAMLHGRAKEILALAADVEKAAFIEFHSGDREPGARLTDQGKRWIIDALQLLAHAGTA